MVCLTCRGGFKGDYAASFGQYIIIFNISLAISGRVFGRLSNITDWKYIIDRYQCHGFLSSTCKILLFYFLLSNVFVLTVCTVLYLLLYPILLMVTIFNIHCMSKYPATFYPLARVFGIKRFAGIWNTVRPTTGRSK